MKKKEKRLTSRILIAMLSVALVFTMMPLKVGYSYAEEGVKSVPIKGNVLKKEMTVSQDMLGSILKTGIEFRGTNNKGNTSKVTNITGVEIRDLINFIGLKDGATIDRFVITTNKIDEGSSASEVTEYPCKWLMEAPDGEAGTQSFENGYAVLAFEYTDDKSVSYTNTRVFTGVFQDMPKANKSDGDPKPIANYPKWIDTITSIEVIGTVPDPAHKKGDEVKASGSTFVVTDVAKKTVAFKKAKKAKSVTVPATVKIKGETYKVTGINAKAFKGTKTKTVTIKTKNLTKKSVKGSLKGSKVKTIKVKVGKKSVNKKYVKKYKKFFTKKNAGKKVKVK